MREREREYKIYKTGIFIYELGNKGVGIKSASLSCAISCIRDYPPEGAQKKLAQRGQAQNVQAQNGQAQKDPAQNDPAQNGCLAIYWMPWGWLEI